MTAHQIWLLMMGLVISRSTHAFPSRLQSIRGNHVLRNMVSTTSLQAAAALTTGQGEFSDLAAPVPYGPHLTIKGKVLNGWGIVYAVVTFAVAVFVLPFMIVTSIFADLTGNGPVS